MAACYGVPPILVTGDEATCREARQFFGTNCVTVAVKKGIGRELIRVTQSQLGPGAKLILLAAPNAETYYSKVGFVQHRSAWIRSR